jgi:membrane fusion protein (multidrug efflux system)
LIVKNFSASLTALFRPTPLLQRGFVLGLALTILLVAGGSGAALAQTPSRPPVEVTVVEVKPQNTPAVFEFTAQTQSSHEVEIRAKVTGYLDKIAYREGELVHQGQLLYQIDPRPFKAALDSARGVLAAHEAQLNNARATLARVKPLAKENAVSQKDLDDATAAALTAQAAVQSAKAQVQAAEINLGYTTIKSPLAGLAGRTEPKEGSLVTAGQTLLTTVVQINPIWVNFGVGQNELLKARTAEAKGQLKNLGQDLQVELVLSDGTAYPHKGRINFVSPSVDPKTGTVNVRAVVPNPQNALQPNQFVRVRLQGAVRPNVIMVPQRAVLQGPKSKFVYVVSPDNTAEVRNVEVGDWYGDQWIINGGLQAGDKVVVDGAAKLQPGAPVKTLETPPAAPPAKP